MSAPQLPAIRTEGELLNLVQSNSLADLAARIRQEHDAVAGALKRSVEHAMQAGDLLIEAKAQVPHGQWLPWLRDHCQVSERMAQRYIQLARNRELIEAKCDTVSDLGMRGALALITVNRSSPDDLVSNCTDLADKSAELALEMENCFDIPKAKADYQLALWEEARAAIETLAEPVPAELAELVNRETQEVFTQFVAACGLYRTATAAECGLTDDEMDQITATIEHAKSQGANDSQVAVIAFERHPDFWHRDPLLGITPTSVAIRVRDLAKEWARQVEMIVAREGSHGEAAP